MSNEHYKKATGRKTRMSIIKLIQDNPQGLDTTQLLTKTGLSMPVLSTHLKALENEALIEFFSDPKKDRRHKFYRIKKESAEQVEGQLLKYQTTQFIEEMNNPVHDTQKAGNAQVSLFSTVAPKQNIDEIKGYLENAATALVFAAAGLRVKTGQKMALIITLDGTKTKCEVKQ